MRCLVLSDILRLLECENSVHNILERNRYNCYSVWELTKEELKLKEIKSSLEELL